jgi:uncharacterized protein (TIGR03437 family)
VKTPAPVYDGGNVQARLILFSIAVLSWAKPPEILRIVNAASQTSPFLAGDELAPGSLLTIWGHDFEQGAGKTSVALAGAWGTSDLKVLQVRVNRIEARLPETVPLGRATITVTAGSEKSLAIPINVAAAQFGIFSQSGDGWGPGRIEEVLASGSRTPVSASNSAPPGSTIIVSGTGLGDSAHAELLVAGKLATVLSVTKAAPDGPAADEIKAVLPKDTPEGCFVPVQVRGAGRVASNTVTLAIRKRDTWCAPPEYLPLTDRDIRSAGLVIAARTMFHPLQGPAVPFDEAGGFFARLTGDSAKMNPLLLAPPPGACTSRVEDAEFEPVLPVSLLPMLFNHPMDLLDGGPAWSINDGKVQRAIAPRGQRPAIYLSALNDPSGRGGGYPLEQFLAPTRLQISGSAGGTGVAIGAFSVAVSGPEPFEWADPISEIDRAKGFDVHWTGAGANRIVMVLLTFEFNDRTSRGIGLCVAPAASGALHVPPESLAAFPQTLNVPAGRAIVDVISWPAHPDAFTVQGADRAIAASVFAHSARVTLR